MGKRQTKSKEHQGVSIPKVPMAIIDKINDTNIPITRFALMAIEEKLERDSKK